MRKHQFSFVHTFTGSIKAASGTLALAVSLTAGSAAEAGTIYVNSPHYPGGYSSYNSQKTTAGINNRTFDNFTLASADTILNITWQGQYRPLINGASEMAPTATDFLVEFWSDSAGTPGSVLSSGLYSVAQTNETRIGSAVFSVPDPPVTSTAGIYDYSLNITPFAAAAGTQYWLMIQAQTGSTSNPAWGWLSGGATPGATYQIIGTGSGMMRTGEDRAFSLQDTATPVPEPTSMALLGAGLVGVASRLRRRRSMH